MAKKRFKIEGLVAKRTDKKEDILDKNDVLIKKVKKLTKEVSNLRTQIKTIQEAWDKTHVFLSDFLKERNLFDLIEDASKGKLSVEQKEKKCKKCNTNNKILIFDKFMLYICMNCGYREKNEKRKNISVM